MARHLRRQVLSIVLAAVSVSGLILGASGSHQGSGNYLYLNLNQEIVEPGQSATVNIYGSESSARLKVLRLDPVRFSENASLNASVETVQDETVALGASSYAHQASVTLDALPGGLYAVSVESGTAAPAWDVLQVTRVGLVARQGQTRALVWAVRLATGEPLADAPLYQGGELVGRTTANGTSYTSDLKRPLVLASSEGVAALAPYPYYGQTWNSQRVAIYTDRPLYRPGQTAHVKLVAWERSADGFRAPPEEAVNVRVSHYENNRETIAARADLRTNEYGSAWLDVPVPETGLGYYSIQAAWRGQTYYGSFQVEEYRLPKFRVDVSPSEARAAVGDPVDFLVAARYFYGEPLTQGKVHYRLVGTPWYPSPCHWCDYRHPYSTASPAPPQDGDLELGPDGTARLRLRPESAGQWRLEAQVTALNGERIDGFAQLDVQPSSRMLHIDWDGWFVKVGSSASVPIRLTDLDGNAMDGPVKATLWHRTWDPSAGEQRKQVAYDEFETSGGRATYILSVPETGSYEIELASSDPQGRTTYAYRWVWAASEDYGWYAGAQLQIIPEKTEYRVGETMRFHVSAPTKAPILVVLESANPLDAKVVDPAHASGVEFRAPAARGPRIEVVALQVAPNPGFLPSIGEKRIHIEIAPRAESLQIDIVSDKTVYEDGETACMLVRVRDSEGRPVRAELSLAMVDEALLALHPGTPTTFVDAFYGYPSYTYTRTSWQGQNWGSEYGVAFAAAGGVGTGTGTGTATAALKDSTAGGGESPPATIKVREFFPETALWLAHVETDALGFARVQAVLPDQLTTWRLTVIGITGDGRAGQEVAELLTRRDLVADLYAPRFLTQKDESTVQATVSNYLGTRQDVRVLLNATGLELDSPASRTLTLSHGQSELVSFAVHARDPGEAVLTLYAWTGDDTGDAVRIRLPVLPHGVHEIESRAGRNSANVTLTIPTSTVGGASRLNLTLSPTIADALVDALPYLTGYPYGCVEQTLSRFMPDIAVAQTAQAFGLNASRIDPNLDDQVQKGLERLYSFQHAGGGWGWWSSDGDNPYTTSYVVYGLDLARDAGYPVREDVLQRGVEALAKMARDEPSGPLRAYALYALSQANASRVTQVPGGSSPAELALAVLVADAIGQDDVARSKAAQLRSMAVRSGELVHWSESEQGWGPYGISSDGMLTALALRALATVDPEDADATGAALWLLNQRRGAAWYTTKETAEAILSLAQYFEGTGELDADFVATVTVDGRTHERRFNESNLFQPRRAIEIPVGPGDHEVSFAREGKGTLYWSVAAHYWREEEPIRADDGLFRLTRTIVDEEGRPVSSLVVGQEAIVRLEVSARDGDHSYVMIEDPLPAGVEVLREESPYSYWWGHGSGMSICYWCGYWSGAEVHDDRVGFFAWWLPQTPGTIPAGTTATTGSYIPEASGPIRFEYRIRAVFPGTYHVMPPRAEEMYDPAVQGHGAESSLTIAPSPSLQVGRVRVDVDRVFAQVYPVGDVGRTLSAVVVSAQGEHSRAVFERAADGIWTVELAAPPTGDFQLALRAGDAATTKAIQRVPVTIPKPVPFNATQEKAWDEGPITSVGRALAERLAPDYAALFEGIPLDPIARASPTVSLHRGWWPVVVLGVAAVAAVGLVVVQRASKPRARPPPPFHPPSAPAPRHAPTGATKIAARPGAKSAARPRRGRRT